MQIFFIIFHICYYSLIWKVTCCFCDNFLVFFFSVLESIKRLYPFLLRNFSIIFFSLNPSLKCSSKFSRYKHFYFISEIRNLLCYVPLQDYHMCSWSPNNNERTYLEFLSSQKQRIVTMQMRNSLWYSRSTFWTVIITFIEIKFSNINWC